MRPPTPLRRLLTVDPVRGKDTRVVEYVERLHAAIANGEMTHDGSSELTRHVLNARRRSGRTGYLLYKAFPDSPDKRTLQLVETMQFPSGVVVHHYRPRTSRG